MLNYQRVQANLTKIGGLKQSRQFISGLPNLPLQFIGQALDLSIGNIN
jgi:hypothetical protein